MKRITQIGLSRIANREARNFTTGKDNSATATLVGRHIHITTTAAGGDNVPWAQKLHAHVVYALLNDAGLDGSSYRQINHCCGTVIGEIAIA